MTNKYMLRINNNLTVIIETDYKIVSPTFVQKLQTALLDRFGVDAQATADFLKFRINKLISFELDEYNVYDYEYEGAFGSIKAEKIQFINLLKGGN